MSVSVMTCPFPLIKGCGPIAAGPEVRPNKNPSIPKITAIRVKGKPIFIESFHKTILDLLQSMMISGAKRLMGC